MKTHTNTTEPAIDCTAKHTPGEWMQNADTVWRGKNPIVCHPVNDPRSIADARLIASAPDLLAALEWLVKEHTHTATVFGVDPACMAHLVAARAAIAKAKGEK